MVWIVARPTQASQRSVASAMKAGATSTANIGMASRAKVLREPIGADADLLGGAEGSGVAGGDTV